MISGVTVTVLVPTYDAVDRFNARVEGEPERVEVANVLVSPGPTADMDASRPEGVTVAYTLHFPKSWTAPLRGCKVELPAPWEGTYNVIGDPRPYIDADTPTPWHLPVEVEAAHG